MTPVRVRDLMTRDVVGVRPETTLAELVAMLRKQRVRSLPVTDNENRLLGIVSETDLFLKERIAPFSLDKVPTLLRRITDEKELDQLDDARQIRVAEVMRRDVRAVEEDSTLEDAAKQMLRRGAACLPVLKDGRVVGVVRRIDILSAIFGTSDAQQD